MAKKVLTLRIEVFDPIKMISNGWTIEKISGNKYHSGGYQIVSPDGKYTIEHTVRVSGGYRLEYNCTINRYPMWTNADLTKDLKKFMIQLGHLEHKMRSESFEKNRSDLLKRFSFEKLEEI